MSDKIDSTIKIEEISIGSGHSKEESMLFDLLNNIDEMMEGTRKKPKITSEDDAEEEVVDTEIPTTTFGLYTNGLPDQTTLQQTLSGINTMEDARDFVNDFISVIDNAHLFFKFFRNLFIEGEIFYGEWINDTSCFYMVADNQLNTLYLRWLRARGYCRGIGERENIYWANYDPYEQDDVDDVNVLNYLYSGFPYFDRIMHHQEARGHWSPGCCFSWSLFFMFAQELNFSIDLAANCKRVVREFLNNLIEEYIVSERDENTEEYINRTCGHIAEYLTNCINHECPRYNMQYFERFYND